MKAKNNPFNFIFAGIVLFTILFQSVHSYDHLFQLISQQVCEHEHHKEGSYLTHSHNNFENCFVCEYSFSAYKSSDFFVFDINKLQLFISYNFTYFKEISILFKGSLFALRAPPLV